MLKVPRNRPRGNAPSAPGDKRTAALDDMGRSEASGNVGIIGSPTFIEVGGTVAAAWLRCASRPVCCCVPGEGSVGIC
jgi:hypothetical protein